MESVLAGLGAALATGIISFLIARRKNSGSISTSDATSLWAESNALRAEYKNRAENLEQQLTKVNTQLQTVLGELTKLKGHNTVMMQKVDELKRIINKLRAENTRLLALKGVSHGPRRTK